MQSVLKKMAFNDYTRKVEGQYAGLFASVAEATNLLRERLLAIAAQQPHLVRTLHPVVREVGDHRDRIAQLRLGQLHLGEGRPGSR